MTFKRAAIGLRTQPRSAAVYEMALSDGKENSATRFCDSPVVVKSRAREALSQTYAEEASREGCQGWAA
ncbi:MAG TPA: hypothetical protein VK530_13130, partial [Candidatus Acidoferrum sp.]|nr:hypothetical protein [Candidatus Acidoferrum sp.]